VLTFEAYLQSTAVWLVLMCSSTHIPSFPKGNDLWNII
jgi:hypothetical protein